jgi:regulator of protease activity HflC (stomatin/prohibitin superfamily)
VITIGVLLGILGYAGLLLLRCFFRVEEGHRALLTSFGALVMDSAGQPVIYPPGLHRKRPWQIVHATSVMEQNLDLSTQEGGRTAMAEDGTVLRFDSVLRYTPIESQLARYLLGIRAPREHIAGLFASLLRNEIANIRTPHVERERPLRPPELPAEAGSYAAVRGERHQLNVRIAEFCRDHLGDHYGIEFRAVDLTDMLPPDELADALNAMMRARSEAAANYARAQASSSQRVLAAERGVEIARASAGAVEAEMNQLASYLSEMNKSGTLDLYVRRRRAEIFSESRATFIRRTP